MTVVLVTGASGFIGANTVAWLLREQPSVTVVSYDAMTYAAHPDTLAMVAGGHGDRHFFVRGDVCDGAHLRKLVRGDARDAAGRAVPAPDAVWHLAAESHVDRSILGPHEFVETNVVGTARLLEAVREVRDTLGRTVRYLQVSTDEVYGALTNTEAPFDESRVLAPSSPYSASKAAADLLVQSWAKTFELDAVITRCSNNYGPFQFPEKLIPLMLTRALADEPLPIYGDGQQVRDWLHAEDHASALWAVTQVKREFRGDVFHVGANGERTNLDVVRAILHALGKPESLIQHVKDRPAHDRRYAMNATKLRRETGWAPRVGFDDGLARTIVWYRAHEKWWMSLVGAARTTTEALYLPPPA